MQRISGTTSIGRFHIDVPDDKAMEMVGLFHRLPGVVNLSVQMVDSNDER